MPIFRPLLDERLSSYSDENFGSAEKESSRELTNSVASHCVRSYISRCASVYTLADLHTGRHDVSSVRPRSGVSNLPKTFGFIWFGYIRVLKWTASIILFMRKTALSPGKYSWTILFVNCCYGEGKWSYGREEEIFGSLVTDRKKVSTDHL